MQPLTNQPTHPAGAHRAPAAAAPAAPVDGCWFCLSSAGVDVNLVASVGDESYVALDKGQISPTHALVVPIEHYPSLLSLPPAAADELLRYLSSLRAAFAAAGSRLVGFERHLALRGKGGNHCHVNVLGVPPAAAEGARGVFEQQAAAAGFELEHVPPKGGQLDRWGFNCRFGWRLRFGGPRFRGRGRRPLPRWPGSRSHPESKQAALSPAPFKRGWKRPRRARLQELAAAGGTYSLGTLIRIPHKSSPPNPAPSQTSPNLSGRGCRSWPAAASTSWVSCPTAAR